MSREPMFRRYRRFFGPDPARDVDDELAFHLERRVEELMASGLSEAEARAAAKTRLGDLSQVREECQELGRERVERGRRADWWDALRLDVRYAIRTLVANRGFAALAIGTMAIGIGANAAVFSVAYGVLLRPLPYPHQSELIRIWTKSTSRRLDFFSVSAPDFVTWRSTPGVFASAGAFERQRDAALTRGDGVESVEVAAVSPDVFTVLGTPAFRGRTLVPGDVAQGAGRTAVISHQLWTATLGADPAVVGSSVSVDGVPVLIVGVMPPGFAVPGTPALMWAALDLSTAPIDPGNRYLRVLGRLAPGVTVTDARQRLETVSARLAVDQPGTNAGWVPNVLSLDEAIVGAEFRAGLFLLVAVVGCVLLIACANTASLQLARAATRRGEIAIRAAFGAGRGRLVAQMLTESVLLCLVAGGFALALAVGGVALLETLGRDTIPRLADVRVDGVVLGFALATTVGSGLLFGFLPAVRASKTQPGQVLGLVRRGTDDVAPRERLRSALVVAEVALAVMLLVGAGLLIRSFGRLQAVDLGFAPDAVSVARIRLPEHDPPDRSQAGRFFAELATQAAGLPGVSVAALVSSPPFGGPNPGLTFVPAEQPHDPGGPAPDADYRVVSPGYFGAVGVRLIRGRDFTGQDDASAPRTVIVSETLARATWPALDPIGRTIRIADAVKGPIYTVAGVVGDVRYQSLGTPTVRPMIYFSAAASPQTSMSLVVRGGSSATLAPALRGLVRSLDPTLPAPSLVSLEELVDQATATPRFTLTLFSLFAGVALLLAVVGVYGVMTYLVRQRTHEFGVRLALGAPRGRLLGSVVASALRLTTAGVTIGLVAAWALTGLMSTLLFGIDPRDGATFVGAGALLIVVGGLGAFVPAWRAARTDPVAIFRGA